MGIVGPFPTNDKAIMLARMYGIMEVFIFRDIKLIQKICRKKKKRPKSIIHKAKLVLPKELQASKKDYSSEKYTKTCGVVDILNCECKQCKSLFSTINPDPAILACKRKQFHLHQTCRTNTSLIGQVDSNPDELASYFEQMLYLPKPMSLMAEMMYA